MGQMKEKDSDHMVEVASDVKEVIVEWLSQGDCPIKINDEEIQEIAEVCEHQALQKNRDTFRSQIGKIVSELVEQHILLGGK